MQGKLNLTTIFRLPVFRSPIMRHPLWRQVAGAWALALLITVGLSTTAFAKGVPTTDGMYPSMVVAQSDNASPDGASVDAVMGVVVVAIDLEGPAAKAGLTRGDILLMAGDVEINSTAALFDVVTSAKPGDELELFVHHGDEPRTIPVTLAQQGERAYLGIQVVDPPMSANTEAVPGATHEVMTATEAISAEAVTLVTPLLVAEVMEGGPAAQAGVVAGDMIMQIDETPVGKPDDLVNALGSYAPGDVVTLTVQRGGPVGAEIVEIAVTLDAAPDDAERPYLGIRFVPVSPSATIRMEPTTGAFPAPVMPAPAMPALPHMTPGYGYSYGYPGAEAGGSCGCSSVGSYPASRLYLHPSPSAGAVPYAVPSVPATPPKLMLPMAPIFIHQYGVNPEIYQHASPGQAERDVIIYRAQPAVPSVETQGYAVQPGMVFMLRENNGVTAWAQTVDGRHALDEYAYSVPPVAVAGTSAQAAPLNGLVEMGTPAPVVGGTVFQSTPQDSQMSVPADEWL